MSISIALNRDITHSKNVDNIIGAAFFTIATALGAYIRIPVPGTPVPITMQTFFVVLAGAVLGKRFGILSQAAYIFLGAIGLPLFQGYNSGLNYIFGPTGGYLFGFMAAPFVVGKIMEGGERGIVRTAASFIAGNLVLYSFGIIWLMALYRISLVNAVMIGLIPFLLIEAAKVFTATFIYRAIKKINA